MNFDITDKCPKHPYVSIDTETTGLNPGNCQVLEFGAVIDDLTRPIEELPRLRIVVALDRIEGEPYALQMNQSLLLEIAQRKSTDLVKANDVVPKFLAFLKANGIDIEKGFQPAGKNFASFDKPFLEANLPRWKSDVKIKHRTIDPGNLYWYIGEEIIPDTKTCYQRAGFDDFVAHNAVEDALGVVRLIRRARIDKCAVAKRLKSGDAFTEAFGYLQAALHPSLLVDFNNPMAMAEAVVRHIKEGFPGDN